jgi:hypothetical protein
MLTRLTEAIPLVNYVLSRPRRIDEELFAGPGGRVVSVIENICVHLHGSRDGNTLVAVCAACLGCGVPVGTRLTAVLTFLRGEREV